MEGSGTAAQEIQGCKGILFPGIWNLGQISGFQNKLKSLKAFHFPGWHTLSLGKKKNILKVKVSITILSVPRKLLPHHYPGSLTVIIPPGPGPRQYQQVEFCVVSSDIGEPSLTNCFSASGWLNAFSDCFQEIGVWLLVPVTATVLEWLKICTALLSFQLIFFFFFLVHVGS